MVYKEFCRKYFVLDLKNKSSLTADEIVIVVLSSCCLKPHLIFFMLCREKFGTLDDMDGWVVLDAFTSVP